MVEAEGWLFTASFEAGEDAEVRKDGYTKKSISEQVSGHEGQDTSRIRKRLLLRSRGVVTGGDPGADVWRARRATT